MKSNALSDVPSQGIEVPHYVGHRDRLRARFLNAGREALPDYELLELALFDSVPRVDVKPLAKHLLKRLGDFADVIAAPKERLAELGLKERSIVQLKIIEAAALRLSKTRLLNRPAISSWSALIDYCAAAMARSGREEFRVLFLDRKNSLIAGMGVDHHTAASQAWISKTGASHRTDGLRLYPTADWTRENEQKGTSISLGAYYSTEYNYHSIGLTAGATKKTRQNGEFGIKLSGYFDQVKLIFPSEFEPPYNSGMGSGGREHPKYGSSPRQTYTASFSFTQDVLIMRSIQMGGLWRLWVSGSAEGNSG